MERIFVIALQLLYFYNVNKKGWIFGIGLIRKRKTAKGAGLVAITLQNIDHLPLRRLCGFWHNRAVF